MTLRGLLTWKRMARVFVGTVPGRAGGITGSAQPCDPSDREHGRGCVRDVVGDMGGVGADEAQQRRSPGVLPGQADEVQPGDRADPALVNRCAAGVHDAADVEHGVVGAVSGRR